MKRAVTGRIGLTVAALALWACAGAKGGSDAGKRDGAPGGGDGMQVGDDLGGQPGDDGGGLPGDDSGVVPDDGGPGSDAPIGPGDGGGAKDGAAVKDLFMGYGDGGCAPIPTPSTNTLGDGQLCGVGCPTGSNTIGVNDQTGMCHCWLQCDPKNSPLGCPCGRRCEPLYVQGDGGQVPSGMGACIPANGPGERCGLNAANNMPYGWGNCQIGLSCVSEDSVGKFDYCMYGCKTQGDCPRGTTCVGIGNGSTSACVINSDASSTKALGTSCGYTDVCPVDSACDGTTCRVECNGPGDTTTCGKCTAQKDPATAQIVSYVCE